MSLNVPSLHFHLIFHTKKTKMQKKDKHNFSNSKTIIRKKGVSCESDSKF